MADKKVKIALCEWCKEPFPKTRKDRRFCSKNCKTYSFLKARRDEAKVLKEKGKNSKN